MNDASYLERCFELARQGEGFVAPNPMVGAVIVKNNQVIGEGYHKKYGQHHAEIEALNNCEESPEGATLYCSLEPCCHTNKQTPPCVKAIIRSGIKKVVLAALDSNPEVAGKGKKELEENGIEVQGPLLSKEENEMNEHFHYFIKYKKPFVLLKWAQTLDGKIATSGGDSKWISCAESREFVHYTRAKYQAILVGINTLREDNPKLNCRGLKKEFQNPIRIIVGNLKSSDFKNNVFTDEESHKTLVFSKERYSGDIPSHLSSSNFMIFNDISDILDALGSRKISSLMIEGGAKIHSSFIEQSLYQKLHIFISPRLLGNGLSPTGTMNYQKISDSHKLEIARTQKFGDDIFIEAYNQSVFESKAD